MVRKYCGAIGLFACLIILLVLSSSKGEATDHSGKDSYYATPLYVSSDMLTGSYWLSSDDSKVLMDSAAIDSFNNENADNIILADNSTISLDKAESSVRSCEIKALIDQQISTLPIGKESYLNGQKVSESYWDDLIELCNMDQISDDRNYEKGVVTQRTEVRLLPSMDFIGESETDVVFNSLMVSEANVYDNVKILHTSKDGNWYFAMFDGFTGWIEKSAVALCYGSGQWLDPEEFLVVTGREIILEDSLINPSVSGLRLPMGTKIPLMKASEAPETVDRRMTYYSYVIQVPVRNSDGYLEWVNAMVPISDDVHVGYLDYTAENELNLAFEMLGYRYGWGGSSNSTDCSGMLREIFRCFGIQLPRSSTTQSNVRGVESVDLSGLSDEQKVSAISEMNAGTLMYYPGHIFIFLGMDNGTPYAISAVGSFADPDMEANDAYEVASVVVNSLTMHRRNGKSWIECLSKAIMIK